MPVIYCSMDGSMYMISTVIFTADLFPFNLNRLTDFDCRLFRSQTLDTLILTDDFCVRNRLTAGATGQQGMLTPPRHLIPPLAGPGVRVSPFIYLICNSYLCFETNYS
jgi:hypothetical protein